MSNRTSPPATSVSPAPAAAGAEAMSWVTMVCTKGFLMLMKQIFKADENKRDDSFEVKEDFKASRIDGVKKNKRMKLLFRGLRRALILGFNSYPPKAYESTLPLINVERQQLGKSKRPVEVDRGTNYDNDSRRRYKGIKGDLTGPLFAFVNCVFTGGCRVVEDVEQHTIGIYSPRSRCTYTLPPIPGLRTGIPLECRCVSLHGRLYVLGGLIPVDLDFPVSSELCFMLSTRVKFIASREVYVMDLTRDERQWKTLPNMHEARRKFGVGVCDEKLFVFGGEFQPGLWSDQSEVFDPKLNIWSRIRPMPSPGINHNVATIGGKLFVHAGVVLMPQSPPQSPLEADSGDPPQDESPRDAEVYDPLQDEDEPQEDESPSDADVYEPLQDEWRVAENWLGSGMDAVFVSDGRLHAMDENGIYLSRGVGSWETFTGFGPTLNINYLDSYVTEALDGIHGGLVTLAHWQDEEQGCGRGILQSSTFREHVEVHWELITFNSCLTRRCEAAGVNPFFCRI